jgi:Zn-dependent peptidase ImmA (M78 family)/transcriptional regulator with XRE-family HTH domain
MMTFRDSMTLNPMILLHASHERVSEQAQNTVKVMDIQSIGNRVRRLRLASGLGQVELADRIGIASGTVSMIETGALPLPQAHLELLAHTLGVTEDYLLRSRPEPVTSRPLLRAYADAPKKLVDTLSSDIVTAVEAIEDLSLKRVPDSLLYYDEDLNDDDAIERFAGEVRTRAGLSGQAIVDSAIRSAERLGCLVLPMDSELGRHLGMSMRVDDVPVLRVSRSSVNQEHSVPGDRQRFTVAHELGHLVLHHASPQPANPAAATKMEREAHRFASAFLTPGDAVVEDLASLGGRVTLSNLASLKEKWGLSIKAFVVRFQQLGVIDDDQARSLYKQISARKWNKQEPVNVANESAVWVQRAIARKFPGSGDLVGDAALHSGVNRKYFAAWMDWSPETSSSADLVSLAAVRERKRTESGKTKTVGKVDSVAKGDISTYNEDGVWKSKVEGSSRAAHTGGTKAEQQAVGRAMARDRGVEHTIRNLSGRIGEKNSYGNDPNPPRG